MSDVAALLNFSGVKRLPVIRQAEAAECGLACVAMIASYFGRPVNLSSLRLRHRISLKGATLKDLVTTAEKLGLHSRPLRLNLSSLSRLQTPCILHWGMNHFVVLKKVRNGRCTIHDPAFGERKHTAVQVAEKFTGVALELTPATGFQQHDDRQRMRLTDLWSKITGLKIALLQTLMLSVILQLFVLVAPFYMQLVVDEVLTTFDMDLLIVLAMGFALLMLVNETASALRSYVILCASNMLGFQIVSNLFGHLLRLPMQWYEKRHVGDIISRFASTRPIRDLFTDGLVAVAIDGIMTISTLVLIFIYSPKLGAVVLTAAFLYVLLRVVLYRPLRQRNEELISSMAREQSVFIESIRGIQSIKIFGQESDRHSVWQNKYADVINSSVVTGRLKIGFDTANGLLFGFENILVVFLAAKLVVAGSLTVGMVFALMAYKSQFVGKVTMLVERLIEFRLIGLHLERIADITLAPPESTDDEQAWRIATRPNQEPAGFVLDSVSYRYADGEPWVLKNVSLTISGSEMLSFVGASGGGKTTLMKLLLGLLEPDSGQILYNGLPLHRFGLSAFRRQVGTVMQDDALLSGSIADNIVFFSSEPDVHRAIHCAKSAMIHNDIMSMPMGYDSLVGDMGGSLSAGQRQRVLLARALYREPEILILDEGTANLDPETETGIVRMLKGLNITRICVAHRAAIIAASDRVVHLHAGSLKIMRHATMDASRENANNMGRVQSPAIDGKTLEQ